MRIQFKYKNHRGLIEDRDVDIVAMGFDFMNHEEFGYQPGWFIAGHDYSRGRDGTEYRSFYLPNIILTHAERKLNHILFRMEPEEKK